MSAVGEPLGLAVLPVILVAVAIGAVARAARAPRAAAWASSFPNVLLRVLEIYLLISAVAAFGIGTAGVAMGTAGSAIFVAIGLVLLTCWVITMRLRRNCERPLRR